MGYISLAKVTKGEVDLLPADGIFHVAPAAGVLDQAVINYGPAGDGTDVVKATIQFAESSDGTTDKDWSSATAMRNALNTAINLANGASGPAVAVKLETDMVCESVTITLAAP